MDNVGKVPCMVVLCMTSVYNYGEQVPLCGPEDGLCSTAWDYIVTPVEEYPHNKPPSSQQSVQRNLKRLCNHSNRHGRE